MKIEITNHDKWHQSFTIKLALLAILGLLFFIPLLMIKEIIRERQLNAEKVNKEISDQWAAKQIVSGLVVNIPVRTVSSEKNEKPATGVWHILPENLDITGTIKPEIRYRGIYQSVVYDSELKIDGFFIIPGKEALKDHVILWNEAYFTVGITDNRGIKGKIILNIDSHQPEAEPGVKDTDIFESGITFDSPLLNPGEKISFNMNINLSGSEGLLFTPLGRSTSVFLQSEWESPSFTGSFLPVNRNIDEAGFTASWEVTHLNRNFPQNWAGNAFHPQESAFGLDLFQPVDHYQKAWRSSRYGMLFIALTFFVLIFIEITRKEAIHIFHYFLVALGLVLFFSLLNSLSEHIGFNLAYVISSVSTILLISIFTGTLFREKKIALIIFCMLAVLYTFIYVLLTLENSAYLIGNIGLFVLLAIIMIFSVRLEFFKSKKLSVEDD